MLKIAGLLIAGSALAASVAAAPGSHPAPKAAKAAVSCPVMKAPVADKAKAPHMAVNNETVYFCCGGCNEMLAKEPAKYLKQTVKDPVTGKAFKVTAKTPKVVQPHALFLFSSAQTKATFEKNPEKYTKGHSHS